MKKGLAESALVVMILALIVGGTLIGVVHQIGKRVDEKADIQVCQKSMFLAKVKKELTYGMAASIIDCPYTPIEMKGISKEKAKRVIAEELSDCWYKNLGTQGHQVWDELGSDFSVCTVCGKFTMYGDNLVIPTEEMGKFLNEPMLGESESYASYIDTDWQVGRENKQFFLGMGDSTDESGELADWKILFELDTLVPEKEYTILYTYLPNSLTFRAFRGGVPALPYLFITNTVINNRISQEDGRYTDVSSEMNQFKKELGGESLSNRAYTTTYTKDVHHHTFIVPSDQVRHLTTCELFHKKENDDIKEIEK